MNDVYIHESSYIDEPVKIGEYAMIAAGSVVTKDVRPHALMMGVPAKQAGWVCECGVRLVPDGDNREGAYGCPVCSKRYEF
jgi:UDP-2-acetamido-3-amino-2,3-dideoxy-glucuronate N-acetyltransferase